MGWLGPWGAVIASVPLQSLSCDQEGVAGSLSRFPETSLAFVPSRSPGLRLASPMSGTFPEAGVGVG
jgi:hypothetical protein